MGSIWSRRDSQDPASRGETVLRLRHATNRDQARVLQFYDAHEHKFVAERNQFEMVRLIHERSCFLVEGDDGLIHATSMCYDHADGRYREMGSSLVTSPWVGLVSSRSSTAPGLYTNS